MINEICGAIMLVLLCALAIFQFLLIVGKPYGQYAWGGAHTVLPTYLRIGSFVSIALYIIFGFIIAGALGWSSAITSPIYMIMLAIYATTGVLLNALSRSKKERTVMVPVTIILAVCSWVLVFS